LIWEENLKHKITSKRTKK